MIRLRLSLELNYEVLDPSSDFIFNIHAAYTGRQIVLEESLTLSQNLQTTVESDPTTGNRYLRLRASSGGLQVRYSATVDLLHYFAQPSQIAEVPVAMLPTNVLGYVYPSRYCQSDRLYKLARHEFGQQTPGYSRAQFIHDWVLQRTTYAMNTDLAPEFRIP